MFSLSRSIVNAMDSSSSKDTGSSQYNNSNNVNQSDEDGSTHKKAPVRSFLFGKRRATNTSSSSSSTISPSTTTGLSAGPSGQPLPGSSPTSTSPHHVLPPSLTPSTIKSPKSSFLPFIDLSIQHGRPSPVSAPSTGNMQDLTSSNDDSGFHGGHVDGGGEGGVEDDNNAAYGGMAPSPPRFGGPRTATPSTSSTPAPRKPSQGSSFLLGLAGHTSMYTPGNGTGHASSSSTSSHSSSLTPGSNSNSNTANTTPSSTFSMYPGAVSVDFAKKMEELGRQRRLEAQLKSGIVPRPESSAASVGGSSIHSGADVTSGAGDQENQNPPGYSADSDKQPAKTTTPTLTTSNDVEPTHLAVEFDDIFITESPIDDDAEEEEDKEEDKEEEPENEDDEEPIPGAFSSKPKPADDSLLVDLTPDDRPQDPPLIQLVGDDEDKKEDLADLDPDKTDDSPHNSGNSSDSSYVPAIDLIASDDSDHSDSSKPSPSPLSRPLPLSPPTPSLPDLETLRQLAAKEAELKEATAANAQLQTMYENLQRDLRAVRLENARLATLAGQQAHQLQDLSAAREANTRLSNLLRDQTEESRVLRTSLDEKQTRILKLESQNKDLQREMATMRTRMTKKDKEEREWDLMHLKLSRAERQLRALDSVTRFKTEAKQETAFGQKKRWRIGPLATSAGGGTIVTDIIRVMNELNDEILQVSMMFAEFAERGRLTTNGDLVRAQTILGTRLSTILKGQSQVKGGKINLLLMQVVLEVFFVHWCVDVIEASYPARPSFADFLIEACAQPVSSAGKLYVPQPLCGRQMTIIPTTHTPTPYTAWVTDVTSDLTRLLSIGGLTLRSSKSSTIQNKITQILKIAYDLRLGLAEKDNLGGLELKVVAPDTLFQKKFMDDAHPDPVLDRMVGPMADFVLGTASIGLQQDVAYTRGGASGSSLSLGGGTAGGSGLQVEIVVKPKVILPGILSDV